ncbi:hypothetical protein AB0N29_20190 [Nocardioides sp. NPDC092400]|uniref:hypothetical protein n=1 Tax=Nocardioides sp. NPDC092400 TaxID=3155196 RepID=UPI00343E26C7
MKKILAGLLTAFLMGTGLVAFTGGSATAAPCYPNCVTTTPDFSQVEKRVEAGTKQETSFNIDVAGSAKPVAGKAAAKGTIKVIWRRTKGGFFAQKLYSYSGGNKTAISPRLNKTGAYKVIVKFIPKKGSTYKRSSSSASFTVVR